MTQSETYLEPVLLIVDDEPINQIIISEILEGLGYRIVLATSGEEAWETLQADSELFDLVILDRMMPGIDGIEVLQRIKADEQLKLLPVILQTAASAPEQIAEGILAGAFYYLTKPFKPEVLRALVATALRERLQNTLALLNADNKWLGIRHLEQGSFNFRTPQAINQVAELLSGLCDTKQTAYMGLKELMLNAVEHGNLGISYAEKTQLIAEDRLEAEVEARLSSAEYADKVASISFRRELDKLIFLITDQGQGFDWTQYLDLTVDRIMDNHGRGIVMARRMAFAELRYLGVGNCVEATIFNQNTVSKPGIPTR